MNRLRIRPYLELIRFSHTLFALPFALLSAGMAWYLNFHPTLAAKVAVPFRWLDLVGILTAMVFARSAAMAFNRVADRHIDAQNPRTAGRHLPAGRMTLARAVGFTLVCSLGFLGSTCCFLPHNPIPVVMAVPVLLFLMGYSLAKRFTHLAHFWLGTALMLAPIAAWVGIRGEVLLGAWWPPALAQGLTLAELSPVALALAVVFWSSGFDVIYACMDAEFDRTHHVFSIPGKFGVRTALRVAAACHLIVILPLLVLGWVFPAFGLLWNLGVAGIAVLLLVERLMIDVNDPKRMNVAFFHVNAVISLALLLLGTLEMALHW